MASEIKDLMVQDAGAGLEHMDAQDFSAPFLMICQGQSPQVQEGNPLYIPEARPGLIMNVQSNHVFKEVTVLPIRYVFKNVEWKPRESGGGFVASYSRGEEPGDIQIEQLTGRLYRKSNGNNIVQTGYHLVMVKEEGWEKVIINMYSTQLKKARRWNSIMAGYRIEGTDKPAPMFSHFFKLSTARETNSKGTWYGWVIEPAGVIEDVALYNQAKYAYEHNANFLPERIALQIGQENGNEKTPF